MGQPGGDLARGGGEQVLPTYHMGDLHQHVIDRDGQRVQRGSVGAHEHEVGDVRVEEPLERLLLLADGAVDQPNTCVVQSA